MHTVMQSQSLDSDLRDEYARRRAEKIAETQQAKARPAMRNVCAGCDHFRLCRDTGGAWLCAECDNK